MNASTALKYSQGLECCVVLTSQYNLVHGLFLLARYAAYHVCLFTTYSL